MSKTEIIGKALVTAIPWVGSSITSIWNDIAQDRYYKRLIEFMDGLKKNLETKIDQLDIHKICTENFQDIFDNTLREILRNRHEEKRKALRNILLNTILRKDSDFDETEMFTTILLNLSMKHLTLLLELKNVVIDEKDDNFAKKLFLKLEKDFTISETDLYQLVIDLENDYLIDGLSSNYNARDGNGGIVISGISSYITSKGNKFIDFINIEEESAT